jgi:hypothetical protein
MTTALQTLRDERARFLALWVLPLLLAGAVSLAQPVLNDADTFWHIATGRWIIDHGAAPSVDPFSYTFAGRPWVTHEWLSEVVMAGAWLAAGWAGVMLLVAVAVGALVAIMDTWLLRWLSPLTLTLSVALGVACVAPGMLARPHLLALPVLALWTVTLLKARLDGRAPPPWLPLVMVAWANLHASFIIGVLLGGGFALEALLDARAWRRPMLIGWAAFLALTGLATLATPHGVEGLAFPLKVLNMKTLPVITEWQGPDFMKLSPLELALLGGLFVAFWRGLRLGAVRAAILLGLTHMSLQHVRQEVLLGVVAPLILAEPLGRALGASAARPISWRLPLPQSLLAAGLIVIVVGGRLVLPMTRVDGPTAPITALAHTPPALRAQPVLNDYDFGGYLIFAGVRPFIDGRADMYGDAWVSQDDAIQRGDQAAIDAAIKRWRIRWAIARPDRPLTYALDRTPGWRRLYADRFAVVEARTGP